ncbi:MAG: hypothetical protein GY871_15800 [Actinomycetales bacterium]|nr:hypothetical protein [Actinomycetales bacterium]
MQARNRIDRCYGISVDHYRRNLRRDAKNKAWRETRDLFVRGEISGPAEARLRALRLAKQQEQFDALEAAAAAGGEG